MRDLGSNPYWDQTSTVVPQHALSQERKTMFLRDEDLSFEQLTDPDYRLKRIKKEYNYSPVYCSRCHHCR